MAKVNFAEVLDIGDESPVEAQLATLRVNITEFENLAGLQFDVVGVSGYVRVGSDRDADFEVMGNQIYADTYRVLAWSWGNHDGSMAIDLRVLVEKATPIGLANVLVADGKAEPIAFEMLNDSLFVDPNPMNDLNADGMVNAFDVAELRRYLAGKRV